MDQKDFDEFRRQMQNLPLKKVVVGIVVGVGGILVLIAAATSFYTVGPKEIRAWTVPVGATGPQAAGAIHTDFERGFIRVEVYSVDELDQFKTEKAIREAGKMRVEGKHYVVRDADVCHFLFNV